MKVQEIEHFTMNRAYKDFPQRMGRLRKNWGFILKIREVGLQRPSKKV
jgi:hypothetical protein